MGHTACSIMTGASLGYLVAPLARNLKLFPDKMSELQGAGWTACYVRLQILTTT